MNNVEDVLTLGQPVEVRVDDIDPQGKVSLSLASEPTASEGSRSAASSASEAAPAPAGAHRDAFEAELVADLGDLGPGGGRRRRPQRRRTR